METKSAKILLDIFIENVASILRSQFGVNQAEGSMFEVIRLLRQENALKPYALELIRNTLQETDQSGYAAGQVPSELTELICHEFDWPELERLAWDRIQFIFRGSHKLAIGDVSYRMLDARKRDWHDRTYYRQYQT